MNAFNLVLNRQDELYALAKALNMPELLTKTKEILNKELFVVLECDEHNNVTKICKKSTGETFENGQRFWSLKYNKWFDGLHFDASLFGTIYFDKEYKNYIRGGDSGLYHLSEIAAAEPVDAEVQVEEPCKPKTIKLDDKEYFLIEKEQQ